MKHKPLGKCIACEGSSPDNLGIGIANALGAKQILDPRSNCFGPILKFQIRKMWLYAKCILETIAHRERERERQEDDGWQRD